MKPIDVPTLLTRNRQVCVWRAPAYSAHVKANGNCHTFQLCEKPPGTRIKYKKESGDV